MKKQAALGQRLHTLRHELSVQIASNAALRLALRCGAAFAGCFLLAGVSLLGRSVTAALALLAAMPFSLAAICAYLGASAGYLVFWGSAGAFEPAAAGFLILAELCIFSGLLPRERKWFLPASSCVLYTLIGVLSLMSTDFSIRETVFLIVRLLLLAVCTAAFTDALERRSRPARGFLAACLLAGCSRILLPGGLPLSAVLAACAVFLALSGADALVTAAACGLALDLSCTHDVSMTAVFTLAALVCRAAVLTPLFLRAALFLGCCLSGVLFTGGTDASLLAASALGVVLALLAPQSLRQALEEKQSAVLDARLSELRHTCDLLDGVSRTLDRVRLHDLEPQSAAVFDKAADQVCRSCGRYHDCWERHASDTYLALSRAACRILQRGNASRDDLPDFFLERCCYPDGFLTAVNEALDDQLARRQYQSRLAESRAVVSDQYRYLSRLLQSIAETPERASAQPPSYTPDLGYRARGVRGNTVSGDHGSCFTCGEWYYVLLCDGMGTGEEASRESAGAIHFLSELIVSGFEPQDAMQMLNGVYILRGDGGFSTIDLLQISLVTGEGFLHKWGAAPSYLKKARRVLRLGSPTPPPGVSAGGKVRPECLRVSMGRGETLLMLSDGTDPAAAEQWLRGCGDRPPRELAAGLLGSCGGDADDRTALALCLKRCAARKKRGIQKEKILSKFRVSP